MNIQLIKNLKYRLHIKMKSLIYKIKYGKNCTFLDKVLIDKNCSFEGGNLLASSVECYNVKMGWGSYIGRNSRFLNTKVGRYTCIGANVCNIEGAHPTSKFVSIHPVFYSLREEVHGYVSKQKFEEYKFVPDNSIWSNVIGNDVWIGNNVCIMEGIVINDGAIIGAGAVVTKDVPPYAIVTGIPAQILKYRFCNDDIDYLLALKWWTKPQKWIKRYSDYFEDIEKLKKVFPESQI